MLMRQDGQRQKPEAVVVLLVAEDSAFSSAL
jgi:hypothetical protein